jgi:hypothetical protein
MKKEYLESLFEDVKEKFDLVMEGEKTKPFFLPPAYAR